MSIEQLYAAGLNGWGGKELAKEAWNMLKSSPSFMKFPLMDLPKAERKMFLYNFTRKVIGKDTPNYAQLIGDCVSFAAKNAGEYLQCSEIALGGEREEFKLLFPSYVYGTSRVLIGGGRLGNSDGSVGSWAADAVVKYGQIAAGENGCPAYSAAVAKQWGYKGPPASFIDIGKQHIIKSAAMIKSWDECVTAVCNGFPVHVCSNRGFSMNPGSDGFHIPSGTWNHAMTIIAVDDTYKQPFGIILNSWGDVMGKLFDFDTKESLPIGTIRAKANVIDSMLRQQDSFAYSNFNGFPMQYDELQRSLFKMS